MISLLEKEARDPVEVLRVKLKDSTQTSLLNSQLLQEIKEGYVARQDSTKGQLDSFVQSHVDEIERASVLLEVERPVLEIGRNLGNLSQRCRQMNDELSEKKISSIVSIARRNLKELETQIVFYEELPSKIQELHQVLDTRHDENVSVYSRWIPFDDWRQKILHELKASATDKSDELGNPKAQSRILVSMASRLDAVESVQTRLHAEVWGCMHHCVEIAQFNRTRLASAFQVLELMEKRRRRFVEMKREYLDNQLRLLPDLATPYNDKCKTEIATYITKRVDEMFRFAEKEAAAKNEKGLDAVLAAANHLLMDLEIVQSEVVPCFPAEIDVMQVYTSTYNTVLEKEITFLAAPPDIGIAQRLQLVQWIEYYNSEVLKYKRARASGVLDQTSQMLMTLYLDQIQGQVQMWVTNVWKREEEYVIGPHGELQSTRPNDIVNIIKSQISLGQEWLTGRLVGRVVMACLEILMGLLKTRYEVLALELADTDVERLCSFINDTDILQAKCPELVEEISFAETDSEQKEAFDTFMGDGLDTTSTEIVQFAVKTCELVVDKMFMEVEHDTSQLWFSKKWDDGDPVVETLLATLDDYYSDLKHWVSGSFFFSKIVRQCLDQCAKEYSKRLLVRTHCISNPQETANKVEKDMKEFETFFTKYTSELRRAGIRSVDDIKKEFGALQVIIDTLRGSASSDSGDNHTAVVNQVKKLMKSTSNQEASTASDKSAKASTAKKKKLKGFRASSFKDKKDKKKGGKDAPSFAGAGGGGGTTPVQGPDGKESRSRESSFPGGQNTDGESGFEVQKLNMADFLGS